MVQGPTLLKGETELVAALIMLVGAAIGLKSEPLPPNILKIRNTNRLWIGRYRVRISVIMKTPAQISAVLEGVLGWWSATVLVLGLVSACRCNILVKMIQGAKQELATRKDRKGGADEKNFAGGMIALTLMLSYNDPWMWGVGSGGPGKSNSI